MLFLKELILRLSTKSPRFFQILQAVIGLLTFASLLPGTLLRWFNMEVPQHFVNLCNDVAKMAGSFLAATLLTSDSKTVATSDDGTLLKKTNEKKLPFTAKHEEKEAVKDLQPTVPEVVEMKEEEANK